MKMKIFGHRGARGMAPENSLLGIRFALREKVDMIELDIRAQNGEIVLTHDPVEPGKTYVTLQEALKKIHGTVPINLDIKEPEVLALLKGELHGYKGKVMFSSFQYKILKIVKNIFPDAELAILEKWSSVRVVAEAALLGTKRIHFSDRYIWSKLIRSLKHHGYDVYVYTVNHRDRAEELEKWGVDGIFTDYPNLFKK